MKHGAAALPRPVILYTFAGRRPNMELLEPYVRRILDENPNVRWDVWDLCRDPQDSKYLRTITGDRITVQRAFANRTPSVGQVRVWQYYTAPKFREVMFVKTDDDLPFIETSAFGSLVEAAEQNPGSVVSALTINHGSSTPHIPDLNNMFGTLGIPLLDVHLSGQYAENCHRWFHMNWKTLINQPATLVPADTWTSINYISFDFKTGRRIAGLLGTKSPNWIMDREFPRFNARGRLSGHRVGDEGAVNMLPVLIHQGCVAGHLTFGPQVQSPDFPDGMAPELLTELRKLYADVARQYLGDNAFRVESNR